VVGNVLDVQSPFSCFLITDLLWIIITKVLILKRAGQLQLSITDPAVFCIYNGKIALMLGGYFRTVCGLVSAAVTISVVWIGAVSKGKLITTQCCLCGCGVYSVSGIIVVGGDLIHEFFRH
jgi:hypothetical protein